MKTAIAITHVNFEHLGLFEAPLRDAGYAITYLTAGIDDLSPARSADVLIVCGAPISVNDTEDYPFIIEEMDILKTRLDAHRPCFGICLGAQLIARALGAKVYAGTHELGWTPLILSDAGEHSPLAVVGALPVLHWHGETFDLPEGAVHLARTDGNFNQAFSIGNYAMGFQFHMEVREQDLHYWLVGHALEIIDAPNTSVKRLRADTAKFAPQLVTPAQTMFSQWLSGF